MPEIEFAVLGDAAETVPGRKVPRPGRGISRVEGPAYPLRHPHFALVCYRRVEYPVPAISILDFHDSIKGGVLGPRGTFGSLTVHTSRSTT